LNHGRAVQINKEIVQLAAEGREDLKGLLHKVESSASAMNQVNVATAIHCLAKALARPHMLGERAATLASPTYAHTLPALVEAKLEEFDPKHVANIIWAWAKNEFVSTRDAVHEKLLLRAIQLLEQNQLKVLELKNVVHAYATMTHDPPAAFTKHKTSLLQAAARSLAVVGFGPDFKAQELTNLWWAWAKLEHDPGRELSERATVTAARLAPSMEPQNLANMLWAWAKLEYTPHPDALWSFLAEVQRRLSTQTFSSQNVVNCLYAVARIVTSPSAADLLLLPRHRPELEALLRKFEDKMGEEVFLATERAQDLSNTMWAMGTLASSGLYEAPDQVVVALMRALMQQDLKTFIPQELKDVVWGFAHLRVQPNARLLRGVESAMVAKMRLFKPLELAMALWALTKLRTPENSSGSNKHLAAEAEVWWPSPVFLEAVTVQAEATLPQFNVQNLTNCLWAYSVLHQSRGAWQLQHCQLEAMEEAVMQRMLSCPQDFSPQHYANVLSAFARFVEFAPRRATLWALARGLDEVVDECQAVELTQAMHSYAHLGGTRDDPAPTAAHSMVPSEGQLTRLAAAIVAKLPEMKGAQVSGCIWSFARMQHTPAISALNKMSQAFTCLVADSRPQEVAMVLWAFAALRFQPDDAFLDALRDAVERWVGEGGLLNAQDIANTLSALASLGVSPCNKMLSALAQEAIPILSTFSPQELANLLWALVLLDVQALPSLWEQARTMLATTHTDFLPEGLCMLYQAHLMWADRGWEGSLFTAAHADDVLLAAQAAWQHSLSQTSCSQTQRDVHETLASMEVVESCEEEFIVGGVLVADIHVQWGGVGVALEVDGPSHFAINTGKPLGRTSARNAMYAARKKSLVCVHYHGWDRLRTCQEKQKFLMDLLQSVPAVCSGDGVHEVSR